MQNLPLRLKLPLLHVYFLGAADAPILRAGTRGAGRFDGAVGGCAGVLCLRERRCDAHRAVLRHGGGLAGLAAGAARREGVPRAHLPALALRRLVSGRHPAAPAARRHAP